MLLFCHHRKDSLLPFSSFLFLPSLLSLLDSYLRPRPVLSLCPSFSFSFFLAKPIFHPWSKTLRHLLESSSIREYSVSAPKQKTVVGELAWHTVELYPDGAGALDRLGGPTASVVFRRASSQHYEHYFWSAGVCRPARPTYRGNLADYTGSGAPSALGSVDRSISNDRLFDYRGSVHTIICTRSSTLLFASDVRGYTLIILADDITQPRPLFLLSKYCSSKSSKSLRLFPHNCIISREISVFNKSG